MSSPASFYLLKNASLALSPVVLEALKHSLPPSLEVEDRFGFLLVYRCVLVVYISLWLHCSSRKSDFIHLVAPLTDRRNLNAVQRCLDVAEHLSK